MRRAMLLTVECAAIVLLELLQMIYSFIDKVGKK